MSQRSSPRTDRPDLDGPRLDRPVFRPIKRSGGGWFLQVITALLNCLALDKMGKVIPTATAIITTPVSPTSCVYNITMLRSTQAFLKQASKLQSNIESTASCASSSLFLAARRASSKSSSTSSSDYDQIMHTFVCNISTTAGMGSAANASRKPPECIVYTSDILQYLQVPSGPDDTKSNCGVDEPCQRSDPHGSSGGEVGSII